MSPSAALCRKPLNRDRRLVDTSKAQLRPIIGLLDAGCETVTPLLFPNRRPVASLHDLIEQWEQVSDKLLPGSPSEKVSDVEILAPLRGRDVLCVGKNYQAHAA